MNLEIVAEAVQKRHPSWKRWAVRAVAHHYDSADSIDGELEGAKYELMAEHKCVKCDVPMGEHEFDLRTMTVLCNT